MRDTFVSRDVIFNETYFPFVDKTKGNPRPYDLTHLNIYSNFRLVGADFDDATNPAVPVSKLLQLGQARCNPVGGTSHPVGQDAPPSGLDVGQSAGEAHSTEGDVRLRQHLGPKDRGSDGPNPLSSGAGPTSNTHITSSAPQRS